ncbi:uncharacterized protein LOC115797375 [Archocentrus centrarchus]|uniref:uncharacterized protein LOC115797375 n=1 Tax=Archocentrus centrarchus TaxID=63155 RepID=UPI0011EA4EE4|nr:uncharacterized protein LOC115797375 [Archocentrus centrarchus]
MVSSPSFCLLCIFLGEMAQRTDSQMFLSVPQETRFISAEVGGKVTLKCFHDAHITARVFWYKHTLGQKPKSVSLFFKYNSNNSFDEEFRNNPRFTLDTENGKNDLTIRDLRISDSATYYCIQYLYTLTFLENIIISVKGSGMNIKTVVEQPTSETLQPGGSVTLNCTVHTGTCDGEHSVYWFKRSSESHPGLIYTHAGRNDQCERKPGTQTNTCVYNLPMNNLNVSHAGTYYCAVASCGHILFGNGTKLDFEDNVGASFSPFWSSAFAFTSILSLLLAFSVCMMGQKCSCKSSEGFEKGVKLFSDASHVNLSNRSRSQRDHTWSECVYYSVKQ